MKSVFSVQGNLAFYYWAADTLCEIRQTQKASSPLSMESKRGELTEVGGCLGADREKHGKMLARTTKIL